MTSFETSQYTYPMQKLPPVTRRTIETGNSISRALRLSLEAYVLSCIDAMSMCVISSQFEVAVEGCLPVGKPRSIFASKFFNKSEAILF